MNVVCLRTAAPPLSALHRLCLLDVYGVSVGKEERGQAVLCGGNACQQYRTDGQRNGGAEWELLPSPFRRPSPPVYARYTLAR